MKRAVIGFGLRVAAATIISAFIVWLWVTPFDGVPAPRALHIATAKVLNFPVAVAGGIGPYRGFEVWPDDHSTWCCFCSPRYALISQMRVSVPTYLLLLYIPALIRGSVRRMRTEEPHPQPPP